MKNNELVTSNVWSLFLKYLFPSVSATLFVSIYVITDTMMIGHGVGNEGLVALNILLPVFSVLFSVGYLLGVGGSVLMSVAKGAGDAKRANSIFTTCVIVDLCIGAAAALCMSVFAKNICYFLGANDGNIVITMEYARILFGFAFLFTLSPLLQNFVKNDNAPTISMLASVAGSLLNVVLDYIFIFKYGWGMKGAILATVIGSFTNSSICMTHFLTKKNTMKFKASLVELRHLIKVTKNGSASALTEISNAVVVFVFNIQIIRYIGNEGVVIYSILSNSMIVVNAILNGVSASSQPVVSYNYGAEKFDRIKKLKRICLATSIIVAGCLMVFVFTKADICVKAFVSDYYGIMDKGKSAIKIYMSGLIVMALNLFYSNYYQSVLFGERSFLIGILRGLILCTLFAFIFPAVWGGGSMWYVMPATEIVTLFIWIVAFFIEKKRPIGIIDR